MTGEPVEGPSWAIDIISVGTHASVTVRYGMAGSRALCGRLTMRHAEADEFVSNLVASGWTPGGDEDLMAGRRTWFRASGWKPPPPPPPPPTPAWRERRGREQESGHN